MNPNAITPLILGVLTAAALAAWLMDTRNLISKSPQTPATTLLGWITTLATAALGVTRWLSSDDWQPLHSHLDGLVFIATLLGIAILYLASRPRLGRVGVIGWPVMAFLLAWALCASAWTYRPFRLDSIEPVWRIVHLACVYLGTLFALLGAIAGVTYLLVYRSIKHHSLAARPGLPSLEWTESAVIRATTLGFAMLTVGLISGVVVVTAEPGRLGPDWWFSPKVLLAAITWLVFALAMNVRHMSLFRGKRAAWLAITGLILLLTVHGLVTAWPAYSDADNNSPTQDAEAAP
ncbi:MAG: cytochrome c biogenesis protein CcsA [Phycisphaeraceae bacterium]